MRIIVVISLLFFSQSCKNEPSGFEPNGDPFEIEFEIDFGASEIVSHERVEFRFSDVLVDQRCPPELICEIDQTEIEIYIDELRYTIKPWETISLNHHKVRLTGLYPEPQMNVEIEKEEYRAKLWFARVQD